MTVFGYARVSSEDQELRSQQDLLIAAGCEKHNIFFEKISGRTMKDRNELKALLSKLQSNDTVIVTDISRLGRSLKDLVEIVNTFKEKNVLFKSLAETFFDTHSSQGEFLFNIFASLAQFEARIISDRTKKGLIAARARGRFGGRPTVLQKRQSDIFYAIVSYNNNPEQSITTIINKSKISKNTFYKYINLWKQGELKMDDLPVYNKTK